MEQGEQYEEKLAPGSIVVWVNIFVAQQFWINIWGPIEVWIIILVDLIRWETLNFERESDVDQKIPTLPFTT